MTFTEYLQAKGLGTTSIKLYTNYLEAFTAWMEGENLSPETFTYNDLMDYMRYLRTGGRSQGVVRAIVRVVRHYGDMLVEGGIRSDNPAAGLYIRGLIRKLPAHILTREELDTLYWQYCLQLNVDPGKKVMLGLLVYQGITVTELIHLEAGHIWLKEQKMLIQASGRQGAERVLPLEAAQLELLAAYLQGQRQKRGRLFAGARGRATSRLHVYNRLKHMITQVQKLNPRVLSATQIRSSVITHWLREHHLRQVQYMAGHRHISSTERYQLSHLEDLQSEIKRHHPLK